MQLLLKRGAHIHEGFKMPKIFGHAHTPLLKCMLTIDYVATAVSEAYSLLACACSTK